MIMAAVVVVRAHSHSIRSSEADAPGLKESVESAEFVYRAVKSHVGMGVDPQDAMSERGTCVD